jgi:hypothetical protein
MWEGYRCEWRGCVGQLVQLCRSERAGSAHVSRHGRFVDAALAKLDANFEAIYAPIGRPSIPPEQLLRLLLLQAFALTHGAAGLQSLIPLVLQIHVMRELSITPHCTECIRYGDRPLSFGDRRPHHTP